VIFIYNLFIELYGFAIRLAAFRNKKAKQWIDGRKDLFDELRTKIGPDDKVIWVHCASAGELEQGKPVIEALKKTYPVFRILVSFFSPSGYAAGKKYDQADIITYLPLDTRQNAKQFISIVNPKLVIFVKYEYWYHHLSTAAFHHIPVLLVSSIFRKDQVFFKWYGKFFRQLLFLFRQIFVQDEESMLRLKGLGVEHVRIGGDTRFDRVHKIVAAFSPIEAIESFAAQEKIIVAGSTWPEDEQLLSELAKTAEAKLIIAPHEINEAHLSLIKKNFPGCFFYSEVSNSLYKKAELKTSVWNSIDEQQTFDIQKKLTGAKVLVIDRYGMLSKLYHYATITYVGGGFNKSGIHNTLEAAVYGKPVLFGPNYHKFREARELVDRGAAFSIQTSADLQKQMHHLLNNPDDLKTSGRAASNYVEVNTGATEKILGYIQEKRLLTRS
jgi:3-deoxy-D-manno-octulosonic-acid transferase